MPLLERVTSGNINIGLGLMLESLFNIKERYDDKRDVPDKVDINKYDYHIYNVLTVIRDIRNSIRGPYKEVDLFNIIVDDMNTINNYYTDTECKVVLMFPDYTKQYKIMNNGKEVKETKKFKEVVDLLEVAERFKKKKAGLLCSTMDVKEATYFKGKMLLTTSYLLDLQLIGICDLLESHTGKLKNKHKVNSKLSSLGKRDFSHIPYNKVTHWVFGDNTLVAPLSIVERKTAYEISLEKKWTTHSSENKIRDDLKKLINLGV